MKKFGLTAKNLEQLKKASLFADISLPELENILGCMNPKVQQYKKNEAIVHYGDPFTGVGVIVEGSAMIVRDNIAGNRTIIAMIDEGDMFGEMAAFNGNGTWPASLVAQENCTVAYFPPSLFTGNCGNACAGHSKMIYNMLRLISERANLLNRKVEYLTAKSIRGKISTFLLEHYKKIGKNMFLLPMKRNELADFLNVSRPSLSREMCKMRDEGIIDFHNASIAIKNIEALNQAAE